MTISEAERSLRSIEQAALTSSISDEHLEQLLKITKGVIFPRRKGKLPTVYRSQKNEGNELFRSVDRLWYPPNEETRQNRLNPRGEPIYYCSNNHSVTIFEQRPINGDLITVLECGSNDVGLTCIVIGDLSHQLKHERSILPGAPKLSNRDYMRQFGKQKVQYSAAFDAVLSRWLGKNDKAYYSLTNWVAKFLFSMTDLDGIIYPTVVWDEGFNLALKPVAADRVLVPRKAFVVHVDVAAANKKGESLGSYRAVSETIRADRQLNWRLDSSSSRSSSL